MQVERTLVKSSPELWAEVSELESLARHLAEFGEITITRVEPETTVAWEGEHASGTVELSASGWGTKVTLTAAVAEIEAEPEPAADPLPAAAAQPAPEPLPVLPEPAAEPLPPVALGPVTPDIEGERAASPADSAPSLDAAPSLSASKRSWLRFWKRPAEIAEPEPPEPEPREPVVEPEPVAIDPGPPVPTPDPAPPTPTPDPGPAPAPDPSPPQIRFDPDRTEAVLTQVLDDLGQAHHRPYSRS
jgi:hypothetical protein